MNLRRLTLRYMGWCPGVKSAAMFIPDKEFSGRTLFLTTISMTSIIVVAIAIQNVTKPEEARSLMVTIYDISPKSERVTYPDEFFDETFNYPELKDKHIEFNIQFEAKFVTSGKSETQIYEFEGLEDVWLLLEELDTPRIVIGFAKWLTNGTFEDVFVKFHGYHPSERGEFGGPPEDIYLSFGRGWPEVCIFEVYREPVPGSVASYVGGFDGIYVSKMKMEASRGLRVWRMYVRLNDAPPFSTVLIRNPYPTR